MDGSSTTRILRGDDATGRAQIADEMTAVIDAASKDLVIASPWITDLHLPRVRLLLERVRAAANRGVRVLIVTRADPVNDTVRREFGGIVEFAIVSNYHSKEVITESVTIIGSVNWTRADLIDNENTMTVISDALEARRQLARWRDCVDNAEIAQG